MSIRSVDDQTIQLAGQSRFDIREFGMEPPRMLMLKVEPEVDDPGRDLRRQRVIGESAPCA